MLPHNELNYGTGLSDLSPAQEKAVTHFEGPCQVIAGPGSGKTAVITRRLRYLIQTKDIDPSTILTITFTKAAALEMADRAGKLLTDKAGTAVFGTFHSVFYKILRNTYRFTSDNIISFSKQSELIKEITEALKIELHDRVRSVTGLLSEISRAKCSDSGFESAFLSPEEFSALLKRYRKRMSDLRLIDFDDMMLLSLDLFKEREKVLKNWQEKFRFLQVDEFQDLDKVQYELINLLAGERDNLFIVGDDDQSIYGFRGADPTLMMRFIDDHPSAEVIYLSENFRSVPEIVDAAGIVISENKERIAKDIESGNDFISDIPPLDIREFEGRDEEIAALKEIIDVSGPEGKALLLRTNELLSFYAEKLTGQNIDFTSRDRIKNIYDHFIAADITGYLSFAFGNRSREDFLRIMNHPYRGISRNALRYKVTDLDEVIRFHSEDLKTVSAIRKLKSDLNILSKMKPYPAVHYILKGMGYERYLRELSVDKNIDPDELFRVAAEVKERAAAFRSFEAWRDAIEEYGMELKKQNDRDRERDKDQEDRLNLMTMHGSKGLEFDEVFLFDVNDGVVPYHRAVLDREIEEERRLLYVGMTRAKKRLHIWYIKKYMGKSMEPSRFLRHFTDQERFEEA